MMHSKLVTEIACLVSDATDPRNDGFAQFYYRQTLYQIKWRIDKYFAEHSDKFVGEEEWLLEQEKQQVWNKLKK
jgi:hypothetical protein